MNTIEFIPDLSQLAWTFGGVEAALWVKPGTVMRVWTEDAFSGRLRSSMDLASTNLVDGQINPQTGPFAVEGAMPGDTLALHFAEIGPARNWGVSCTVPLFGGLTGTTRTATLQDPLPERTWIYQIDRASGTLQFHPESSDFTLDLPIAPMLGTIGVAPPNGEVRSSMAADTFGGNLDTPEIRTGATCYLGVNVEGALFSIGDGHYRQGEGEACGTAVEGPMNVTLLVDLIKGNAPASPRIEHDDSLAVVGSARPLEDAWRISQCGMVHWLSAIYGLDTLDSYQLLSQISEAPLANVVDPNYSSVTRVSKALLPSGHAYDGIHAHLRDMAIRA
ncbi:MAG: acetamidase/formamidase family protein [Steroidobacteraceae bacterium]